jgi:hypothetical protein
MTKNDFTCPFQATLTDSLELMSGTKRFNSVFHSRSRRNCGSTFAAGRRERRTQLSFTGKRGQQQLSHTKYIQQTHTATNALTTTATPKYNISSTSAADHHLFQFKSGQGHVAALPWHLDL